MTLQSNGQKHDLTLQDYPTTIFPISLAIQL